MNLQIVFPSRPIHLKVLELTSVCIGLCKRSHALWFVTIGKLLDQVLDMD